MNVLAEDGGESENLATLFINKIRSKSIASEDSPFRAGDRLSTKFVTSGYNSARLSQSPSQVIN